MLKELKIPKANVNIFKEVNVESDFMKMKNEQARKTIARVGLPKELTK